MTVQVRNAAVGAGHGSMLRSVVRLGMTAMLAMALTVPVVAPAAARSAPDSFADLAEKLLPAVVNVATTQTVQDRGPTMDMPQFPPGSPFEEFFKDFFDRNGGNQPQRPRRAQSLGSGFLISDDGLVVTNNHVIADADEITVRLSDDSEFPAKLIGTDTKTDVAVLKIDTGGRNLPYVKFGNSDKLRVGDWVVAIGNPFGLGGTVTAGIVSARGRDIGQGPYDDFIQTDASINRGNSGGPLFNLDGDVIGINTAIFSQSGGSIGIGFAISSKLASNVVGQLREFGRTRRGWLGVRIQQVTDEIAESLSLDKARGALVADVTPDGPAKSAGIQAGDVILKFAGQDVAEMRELPRIVAETQVGKTVNVEVWRDGKLMEFTAKLGELEAAEKASLKQEEEQAPSGPQGAQSRVDSLGLGLATLTPQLRAEYSIGDQVEGVVVTEVDPAGTAGEKGLRPGDVIVEVAQDEVRSPDDVARGVKAATEKGRKSVLLLIDRQGEMRFVALRIDKG